MDFGVLSMRATASDMHPDRGCGVYATDEMEQVYSTVLAAQLAGIAATKAGVPGCEVDGAARQGHCRRRLRRITSAMATATAWAWKFMRPQTAMLPVNTRHARWGSLLRRAWHLSAWEIRRPDRGCGGLSGERLQDHPQS